MIELIRVRSDDQGTLGFLLNNDKLICWTIECPWHDNRPFVSCIPGGEYEVIDHYVKNVPGRTHIKFHSGNWAGDSDEYRTDSKGCILPGMKPSKLLGQRAVIGSRKAMLRVPACFELRVINYYEL